MKISKLEYGTETEPLIEHLRLNDINNASASIGTVAFKAGQRVPDGEGQSVHDQDEVSIVLEGRITLQTDDKNTTLDAGTLVHIPAGVAHSSVAVEDTRIYFMLIG